MRRERAEIGAGRQVYCARVPVRCSPLITFLPPAFSDGADAALLTPVAFERAAVGACLALSLAVSLLHVPAVRRRCAGGIGVERRSRPARAVHANVVTV